MPAQEYGPISIRPHVALDCAYVVLGLVAPWWFGFSHHTAATACTIGLALFGLALNLVILVPWLFFAEAGAMPWFLSAVGIAILLNSAFTRPLPIP
jgi:hypothetical protein